MQADTSRNWTGIFLTFSWGQSSGKETEASGNNTLHCSVAIHLKTFFLSFAIHYLVCVHMLST